MAIGGDENDDKARHHPANVGAVSSRLSVDVRMDEDGSSGKMASTEAGVGAGIATVSGVETATDNRLDLSGSPVSTERLAEYELSSQLGNQTCVLFLLLKFFSIAKTFFSVHQTYSNRKIPDCFSFTTTGDGAYGTVLLASHKRTNQTVAIKRFDIQDWMQNSKLKIFFHNKVKFFVIIPLYSHHKSSKNVDFKNTYWKLQILKIIGEEDSYSNP